MFLFILKKKLAFVAGLILWRYKPLVIGITGSVGKTSAKEVIFSVLKGKYKMRRSKGNLNNELGVPMAVIGEFYDDYAKSSGVLFWSKVIFVGLWKFIAGGEYPEVLIIEMGADKPGDIESLSRSIQPRVGVVTAVGDVPAHIEFYASPKELASEKSKLIRNLPSDGKAILNFDDLSVYEMRSQSLPQVFTFGFGEGADVRVVNFEYLYENEKPTGMLFKVSHYGSFTPIKIKGAVGKSQGYAVVAGIAVGISLGMNLVDASAGVSSYQPSVGRMRLIQGIKNSLVIDDTYNSSPSATHSALDALSEIKSVRKIAILGDMLELGVYSVRAHQEIGNMAAEKADILMCVGEKSALSAEAAYNRMIKDNIYVFDQPEDAISKIKEIIKEGDLILVKGSQGMRMEKIVEEIMAEPQFKKELLVRQGESWKRK